MWQDSLKPALRRWMVGTLIALAYADMTGSCTPQPAANRVLVQAEPATDRMAALQQQADREATQWEAAYSHMSDQERMSGIVYEPVSDRLPETGRTKP